MFQFSENNINITVVSVVVLTASGEKIGRMYNHLPNPSFWIDIHKV